jgi:hypothetical protein
MVFFQTSPTVATDYEYFLSEVSPDSYIVRYPAVHGFNPSRDVGSALSTITDMASLYRPSACLLEGTFTIFWLGKECPAPLCSV